MNKFKFRQPPQKPERQKIKITRDIFSGCSLDEILSYCPKDIHVKEVWIEMDEYEIYLCYNKVEDEERFLKKLEIYATKLEKYNEWLEENEENIKKYEAEQKERALKKKERSIASIEKQINHLEKQKKELEQKGKS